MAEGTALSGISMLPEAMRRTTPAVYLAESGADLAVRRVRRTFASSNIIIELAADTSVDTMKCEDSVYANIVTVLS